MASRLELCAAVTVLGVAKLLHTENQIGATALKAIPRVL
jgi:hypothetical protein